MRDAIVVEQAGYTTVQDLGRTGFARTGVAGNGAADRYAARVANVLVGNPDRAPLLEVTGSRLVLVTRAPLLLAATGAAGHVTVDANRQRAWEPMVVTAGQRIAVEPGRFGLRCYVAVNGVLDAAQVLGSVAPDPLLGAGTRLSPGKVVRVASAFESLDHPHFRLPVFDLRAPRPPCSDTVVVDVTAGPDTGRFGPELKQLYDQCFTVSPQSDHIGLRLLGATPQPVVRTEILSRGVPLGAIEIPPTGGLIALLRGRPVTAGYPVVAVATAATVDRLGQVRPGDRVRLRRCAPAAAAAALVAAERGLHDLARRAERLYRAVGIGGVVHPEHLSYDDGRTGAPC